MLQFLQVSIFTAHMLQAQSSLMEYLLALASAPARVRGLKSKKRSLR